ncbi:DUF4232 domain-containing protein [Streptomyces sp. NPDC091377]|uniref:DUF4232 domain-containing protein n=1 Tax=Streptomyces sp. NPDC091377 TaxID=3365995 RepID=UPI0037F9C633
MRARPLPFTVLALAGALFLTACGGDGDGGGGSDGGAGGAGDGKASGAGAACVLAEVKVETGPAAEAPADGDTGNVPVTVTNEGEECVLDGFPAVRLKGGDTSLTVPADEAAAAQELTLPKDVAATFTLTYVRGAGLDADNLLIGLPGDDGTTSLAWSYGPVALVDGEPDASVSAFQQAGD